MFHPVFNFLKLIFCFYKADGNATVNTGFYVPGESQLDLFCELLFMPHKHRLEDQSAKVNPFIVILSEMLLQKL